MSKQLSGLLMAFHHLKIANDYLKDVARETPNTKGAYVASTYSKKVDWLLSDVVSNPVLSREVIDGIKLELESDNFTVSEIMNKVVLLSPKNRENLELFVDELLKGKEIVVQMAD